LKVPSCFKPCSLPTTCCIPPDSLIEVIGPIVQNRFQ
jgi:hypothetical protein